METVGPQVSFCPPGQNSRIRETEGTSSVGLSSAVPLRQQSTKQNFSRAGIEPATFSWHGEPLQSDALRCGLQCTARASFAPTELSRVFPLARAGHTHYIVSPVTGQFVTQLGCVSHFDAQNRLGASSHTATHDTEELSRAFTGP